MKLAARLGILASAVVGIIAVATAPVLAASVDVSIAGRAFEPTTITINQGDTVTWTVTNSIGEPHSVTSGTPQDSGKLFDSGLVLKDNGQSFPWTFDKAGEYPYYCAVHPAEMTGKVVVLAEGANPPASGEPASSGEPGPAAEHTGVPAQTRLIAGAILVVAIVLMFGLAAAWRRMNPA